MKKLIPLTLALLFLSPFTHAAPVTSCPAFYQYIERGHHRLLNICEIVSVKQKSGTTQLNIKTAGGVVYVLELAHVLDIISLMPKVTNN